MTEIYRFLASYEGLIYIVLAIGGMFAFRWLWNSWREWQMAIYRLEREFSLRRLNQALAISALIVILFCAEFIVASFITPGLPADVFVSTPTLNLFVTPTGTLSAEMMTQFAAGALPPASNADASGCIPGQLTITSPKAGAQVTGAIELVGTVNIPNFGFYKYEVAPRGSDTWAAISAGRNTVVDGTIGRWDTSALTPGDYQLRIIVTDNQGQSLPACVIPIQVKPAN
jgi:hypothetical protein